MFLFDDEFCFVACRFVLMVFCYTVGWICLFSWLRCLVVLTAYLTVFGYFVLFGLLGFVLRCWVCVALFAFPAVYVLLS